MMLVLAVVGTLLVALWIWLFVQGGNGKYNAYIEPIDKEEYFMPELFFIGFEAISLFKIDLKASSFQKFRKKIADLRGERFADFYLYVITGAQLTYFITIVPITFLFGIIVGEATIALAGLGASLFLAYYLYDEVNEKLRKREDQMMQMLPQALSTMALLINAGMPVRQTWEKVAYSGTNELNQQMQTVVIEMQNGVSMTRAIHGMGERCDSKELRKFCSMLVQNLQKGNAELVDTIRAMSEESWMERKNLSLRRGEAAGQKLLIPTAIMFAGVIMMIVVPIFTQI